MNIHTHTLQEKKNVHRQLWVLGSRAWHGEISLFFSLSLSIQSVNLLISTCHPFSLSLTLSSLTLSFVTMSSLTHMRISSAHLDLALKLFHCFMCNHINTANKWIRFDAWDRIHECNEQRKSSKSEPTKGREREERKAERKKKGKTKRESAGNEWK